MKTILSGLLAFVFAVGFSLSVEAGSRPRCDRNPGDYLGKDGLCHTQKSHKHKKAQNRHRMPVATPVVTAQQPDAGYTAFVAACKEQETKRRALGLNVTAQITNNNGTYRCHVDGGFTERGKI